VFVGSKVKSLDTELHIATTTLKSLELSESKVCALVPCNCTISLARMVIHSFIHSSTNRFRWHNCFYSE